jgi:predicted MFS family arabinose efflux permease
MRCDASRSSLRTIAASDVQGVAIMADGGARTATFREVLAIREFRALYLAQTLSVIGDQLARIAVAVLIFTRTGSATLTGVSYAVSYLPWLIGGPTLSVLADRFPRRTVMVVCDTARAALVCLLSLRVPPTLMLISLVAVVALLEPPFAAARASLVPDVVGSRDAYTAASTLGNATSQIAVVAGFAGGGLLTSAIGARQTLLIDGLSFATSALVVAVAVRHRPATLATRSSWLHDMRDGAAVVFGNPELRWFVTASWLVVGGVIATEAIAVPYAHAHGQGATTAGALTASLPLGVTVGALLLGRVVKPDRVEALLPALAVMTPLVLAFTGFNPPPAIVAMIWFVAGALSAMSVAANRLFVAAVPAEVRGRAFGIAASGISTSQGLGSLLVGLLAHSLGPARAVDAIALPVLALTLLALRWKIGAQPASAARA